jgi:hypothetical protein
MLPHSSEIVEALAGLERHTEQVDVHLRADLIGTLVLQLSSKELREKSSDAALKADQTDQPSRRGLNSLL